MTNAGGENTLIRIHRVTHAWEDYTKHVLGRHGDSENSLEFYSILRQRITYESTELQLVQMEIPSVIVLVITAPTSFSYHRYTLGQSSSFTREEKESVCVWMHYITFWISFLHNKLWNMHRDKKKIEYLRMRIVCVKERKWNILEWSIFKYFPSYNFCRQISTCFLWIEW